MLPSAKPERPAGGGSPARVAPAGEAPGGSPQRAPRKAAAVRAAWAPAAGGSTRTTWANVRKVMQNRKLASDINAQLEERRRAELEALRVAMRRRFHPEGRFRRWWNTAFAAAALLSGITIPLFAGLYAGADAAPGAGLLALQAVLDVFVVLDTAVALNTAAWDPEQEHTLVPDPTRILRLYARSWLAVDALGLVPFSLVATEVWAATDATGWWLRLLRVLRMLRFLRMGSQRTVLADSDVKQLNGGLLRMGRLFVTVAMLAHTLACGWFLVGFVTAPHHNSWLEDYGMVGESVSTQYIAALYWTVTTQTGVGYGDITGMNTAERLFAIMTMLTGAAMFGFIIGNISSLLEGIDRRGALYKRKLTDVKETLRSCQVPKQLQRRVRKYYEYYMSHKSLFDEEGILNDLSQQLRIQVIMEANKELALRQAPFIKAVNDMGFVATVFAALKPVFQGEGDVICRQGDVGKELYFLHKGAVEMLYDARASLRRRGVAGEAAAVGAAQDDDGQTKKKPALRVLGVLTGGAYFGDLALVLQMHRCCTLRALMPSEMFHLAKEDLVVAVDRYPEVIDALEAEAERRLQLLQDVMYSYGEQEELGAQRMRRRAALQGAGVRGTRSGQEFNTVDNLSVVADLQRAAQAARRRDTSGDDGGSGGKTGDDGGTGGSVTRKLSATTLEAIESAKAEDEEAAASAAGSRRPSVQSSSRSISPMVDALSQLLGVTAAASPLTPARGAVHDIQEGEPYALYNFAPTTLPGIRLLVGSAMSDAMRSFFKTRRHSLVAEEAAAAAAAAGELEEVAEEDEEDLWRRFILHPSSMSKLRWDIFIALLIVYSVVTIPVRIGFQVEPEGGALVFDVLIDCFFFLDMAVSFRTAYYDEMDVLVTIPRRIAAHYARTWLVVDLVSTLPVDHVTALVVGGSSQRLRSLKLLRAARLARLLKLLRLLKLSKFMHIVEEAVDLTPALMRLLKLLFQVSLVAHWSACFWYFNTSDENDHNRGTWWLDMQLETASTFDLYVASVYWAFMTMTTVGYGDVLPYTNAERLYAIGAMVVGATTFGYIVGSMASLVAQLRGVAARNKERLAEIKAYMNEQRLSPGTRRTLLAYFETYYAHRFAFHARSRVILSELSDSLRKKLVLHMYRDELAKTVFFQFNEDENFVSTILQKMSVEFCRPDELVFREGDFGRTVYFLVKGTVQIVGNCGMPGETVYKVLHEGSCFGEIAMLMSVRRTASIRAVTFCTMLVLEKADYDALTSQYPELGEKFRAIFETTLRGMKTSAEEIATAAEGVQ